MKCHPQLDLLEFPKLHFSRKLRGRLVSGTEVFEGSMMDDHGNDLDDNAENENERKPVEKELEPRNFDEKFIPDVKMMFDNLKAEEMLIIAKLPDPPSGDPNEGDIKDEEIL